MPINIMTVSSQALWTIQQLCIPETALFVLIFNVRNPRDAGLVPQWVQTIQAKVDKLFGISLKYNQLRHFLVFFLNIENARCLFSEFVFFCSLILSCILWIILDLLQGCLKQL